MVSINKGLQQEDWLRAERLLESGEVSEAKVASVNRGGVLVSFGRLNGFVPNSHLTSIPRGLRGQRLREAKAELIGQDLSMMVIEVNQRRRRLVLSEREAESQRREQLLEETTEGDVRPGVVTNLVDFGAFVDLGIGWPDPHIRARLEARASSQRGAQRRRQSRGMHTEGGSRKGARWTEPEAAVVRSLVRFERMPVYAGQVVEGTVTNVKEFGAFVDVGEGVEGLVHISEMPTGKPTLEELPPGSMISVRVLEIDHDGRRIGLSLRNVANSVSGDTSWHRHGMNPVDAS